MSKLNKKPPFEEFFRYRKINAALLAIVISLLVLWFQLELGWFPAIMVIIAEVFSKWLTDFTPNLWWSAWVFYLPLLMVMFYLRKNTIKTPKLLIRFGLVIFIPVFIKCFFNGYEYMTTVLIMMAVPLVYYGMINAYSVKQYLQSFGIAIASSLFAMLIIFLILWFQISAVKENFKSGVSHIVESVRERTHGSGEKVSSSIKAACSQN